MQEKKSSILPELIKGFTSINVQIYANPQNGHSKNCEKTPESFGCFTIIEYIFFKIVSSVESSSLSQCLHN